MASDPVPSLTPALSALSQRIAADIRAQILAPGPVQDRARSLHADERVGDDFAVWTDLLSRRAAVLWVLRSVYVRVLEDRGLLRPLRIVDAEAQHLFERLAPNLGQTAYLRWIYRDLASGDGGLPELFASQPAEVALPSDALSRELLDFWRERDPDTGALRWAFTDAHFDGRLMGDLYQDLDPVVKDRFALCQTPDFILNFILDETLSPAIAEWGVETVRLIDPACGSGHFLLAGFKRLIAGMREKFPERDIREIVLDVLPRVVGLDLNDYACALARARLVMTALELSGEGDLGAAAAFHPQVYWTDALEQVERDEMAQLALPMGGTGTEKPRSMLTRPEVRMALRPLLALGFHTVVGNPPYNTEKDPRQKEYHRQKIGKRRRYLSASGKYSLGAPFTERMFQLAIDDGFVGEITANSFMKRAFGKALIETVLAQRNLTKVIDTSGILFASFGSGFGTATVMLFARNQRPLDGSVRVVMGKRSDSGKDIDPRLGGVWSGISAGHKTAGFETDHVSVADVTRRSLDTYEWSIGGGGAADLQATLDALLPKLSTRAAAIGIGSTSGEDSLFLQESRRTFERHSVEHSIPVVEGDAVRNWSISGPIFGVWPYDESFSILPQEDIKGELQYFWHSRTIIRERHRFGKPVREIDMAWYEWQEVYPSKLTTPMAILVGELATHNHFSLDRGGKIFSRTAPVIALPPGSSEADHLVLLSQLNSSTACFWLKQICHNVSGSGVGRGIQSEDWMGRRQFTATKLRTFPLASVDDPTLVTFARHLDQCANSRVSDSARSSVDAFCILGAPALRTALDDRRKRDNDTILAMVALQEELDWYCYKLYAIDPTVETRSPDAVPPLCPGLRPFEIALARRDAENRAVLARGEEPDEAPTAWFTRHNWDPHTTLDALDPAEQRIVEDRLARTESSRELGLLEQPTYKRRWYQPDYAKEEREALTKWLADRIEDHVKARRSPWTIAQVALALGGEADVRAVCEVLTGRNDYDMEALIGEQVRAESVPNNKHHVFKPDGLIKRAAWEETWAQQHMEDEGKPVTPAVPPKYASGDYLRSEYWSQRGKLDVPKERFIAFTEVPSPGPTRYGWAGWTHRARARTLVDFDEQLENDGVPVESRIGVLHGVGFLLPWVKWESSEAAEEFRAIVQAAVGREGVTEAMLMQWAETHPPGGVKEPKAPKAPKEPKTPKAPRAPKAPRGPRKEGDV
jgi:hypothetical protein